MSEQREAGALAQIYCWHVETIMCWAARSCRQLCIGCDEGGGAVKLPWSARMEASGVR